MAEANLFHQYDEFYDVRVDASIVFRVPRRYVHLLLITSDRDGTVCGAYDTIRNQKVAIKLKYTILRDTGFAKVAFKEFCLLKKMNHQNVTTLYDAFIVRKGQAIEFYFVTELMDGILEMLCCRRATHMQLSCWLFQILSGINYLHSFGLVLRHLKPCHVGFCSNGTGTFKILDFSLAKQNTQFGLHYVSPAPYQAPEIILMNQSSAKSDAWSAGCLFGEMLLGKSVFESSVEILPRWFDYVKKLGMPKQDYMNKLPGPTKKYLELQTPKCIDNEISFEKLFPDEIFPVDEEDSPYLNKKMAKDLLKRILVIDPEIRISVDEALNHEYLRKWPRSTNESVSVEDLLNYDQNLSGEMFKHMMIEEVEKYRVQSQLQLANNPVNTSSQSNNLSYFDRKYQEFYNFRTGYYTNNQEFYLYKPDTHEYYYWNAASQSYMLINTSFIQFVLNIENSSRMLSQNVANS